MTDTRDINQSGPPYPPLPAAGSNAIGKEKIGVAQIGDIQEFNYWDTVASQYANSPAITGIIARFAASADQTQNLDSFYDNIWNIATAGDYGLDVWGRIVGVNRILKVQQGNYFGFAEGQYLSFATNVQTTPLLPKSQPANSWQGFGQSNLGIVFQFGYPNHQKEGGGQFYTGLALTSSYTLSTESYRYAILAKAGQNITDSSIPNINVILKRLFPGRGNAYVSEGSMSMTYNFNFALTPFELAIVKDSGVLPKPTGVRVLISSL